MHVRHLKPGAALVTAALAAALAAGCGSDSSSSTSSSASTAATSTPSTAAAAPAADVLGTPKAASGAPLVLGLLNLESGPVTFPEYRQAAEAAVKYVNAYKGGIGGRPLKIEFCATDGQPSTSARCAGQVLDKKPTLILGGADTGNPGAQGVYQRAKVPYIGGIPFTPVEKNSPNAVEFISVAEADLAATLKHAADGGVKKLAVIFPNDTQGKAGGLGVITPVGKQLGMEVKPYPISPSASDLSSVAASALSGNPDAVFVDSPNACPALLKALKAVGYSGKLLGIDVCASPPALAAAGDAAEGLVFAQPFPSPGSGDKDVDLFMAATGKYAPKDMAVDSISQAGFSSVMNIQKQLDTVTDLTSANILKAFKTGTDLPNFMAHPYTCDGKQIAASKSVCNGYEIIKEIKGGKITTPGGNEYITAAQYIK